MIKCLELITEFTKDFADMASFKPVYYNLYLGYL